MTTATPVPISATAATIQQLGVQVAKSFEAIEPVREEWDRLVEATGAPIYLTYDWCKVWWAHYGANRELRLFLIRRGNKLVAVMPMCIDRVRLGPVNLRVAKIIGSDFTQAVCDLPIRADWSVVLVELFERLIGDDGCDGILFAPLSDASKAIDMLRGASQECPDLMSVFRDRVVTQHTTIALPDTFDAYLKSLSKNQRFSIRKGWKRLSTNFDVSVEVVTERGAVLEEFHEFVRMHGKQWRRQGKLGHFGDWPNALRFNRSLVSVLSETGRVRLVRIRADSHVVARQYSFVFGGTCYCRLSARAIEPEWKKYGLGRLSLVKLLEHVIDEGVRMVDVGVGRYDYKLRVGATEQDLRSLLFIGNRRGVRSRARLCCLLADALDRCYYKLWFSRVAPKLPWRQRPLWKTWIRSRL